MVVRIVCTSFVMVDFLFSKNSKNSREKLYKVFWSGLQNCLAYMALLFHKSISMHPSSWWKKYQSNWWRNYEWLMSIFWLQTNSHSFHIWNTLISSPKSPMWYPWVHLIWFEQGLEIQNLMTCGIIRRSLLVEFLESSPMGTIFIWRLSYRDKSTKSEVYIH